VETEIKPSKTSPKRELILLIVAIGLAVNAAIWYLYAAPFLDDMAYAKQTLAEAEAEAVVLRSQYTLAPSKPVDDETLDSRLPEKLEQSVVLKQLHEISAQSGVLLANYAKRESDPEAGEQPAAASSDAQTMSFTLTLAGPIESLSGFLDRIQQYDRLYTAKSWSINSMDDAEARRSYPGVYDIAGVVDGKPILLMHLSAETYAYRLAAETKS
jgi:hypothetical protein